MAYKEREDNKRLKSKNKKAEKKALMARKER